MAAEMALSEGLCKKVAVLEGALAGVPEGGMLPEGPAHGPANADVWGRGLRAVVFECRASGRTEAAESERNRRRCYMT